MPWKSITRLLDKWKIYVTLLAPINNNNDDNNSASPLSSGACQGNVWSWERTGFPDFNLKHSLPALLVDCGDCGAPGRQLSSGIVRPWGIPRPWGLSLSQSPSGLQKTPALRCQSITRRPLPYGGFEWCVCLDVLSGPSVRAKASLLFYLYFL